MTAEVPRSDRTKFSQQGPTSNAQQVEAILDRPSRRLTTVTTLGLAAWWLANLVVVQAFSNDDIVPVDARISAEATAQGSAARQALVVSFALLGALHWRRAWRVLRKSPRHRRLLSAVLVPFALYVTWAILSTVWSVAPELTIRRIVSVALLLVGGMGIGAGFYGNSVDGLRALARHVAVAGVLAMGVLWLPKLVSGDVSIFDPKWSLRAVAVGSIAAFPISFGALAALYVAFEETPARSRDARRLAAVFYLIFAFLSLFALRKRVALTVFLVVTPAFVMASLGGAPRVRRLLGLLVTNLVGLLLLLQLAVGLPLFEQVITVVLRDSDPEQLSTLTSRVPLWDYLLTFASDRPLAGYGFGAFWNPEMIREVQASVGWAATGGHSGFLDELLATGTVGLLLMMSALSYGAVLAFRISTGQQRNFARLVMFWIGMLLALNITTSIMQSYFKFPFYVVVIGLFAVAAWDDGPQQLAPAKSPHGSMAPIRAPRSGGASDQEPTRKNL